MLPRWFEGSPLRMKLISRTLALVISCAVVAGDALAQDATDKDKTPAAATEAKPGKASAPGVRILFVNTRKTARGETAEICVTAEDRGGGIGKVELAVDGAKLPALARSVVEETGVECPANSWVFETELIPGRTTSRQLRTPPTGRRQSPRGRPCVEPALSPAARSTS